MRLADLKAAVRSLSPGPSRLLPLQVLVADEVAVVAVLRRRVLPLVADEVAVVAERVVELPHQLGNPSRNGL